MPVAYLENLAFGCAPAARQWHAFVQAATHNSGELAKVIGEIGEFLIPHAASAASLDHDALQIDGDIDKFSNKNEGRNGKIAVVANDGLRNIKL